MKYTQEQIQDLKSYLYYNVKEGYLDEDTANEIVQTESWGKVEEMIDRADAYADAVIKGEV